MKGDSNHEIYRCKKQISKNFGKCILETWQDVSR